MTGLSAPVARLIFCQTSIESLTSTYAESISENNIPKLGRKARPMDTWFDNVPMPVLPSHCYALTSQHSRLNSLSSRYTIPAASNGLPHAPLWTQKHVGARRSKTRGVAESLQVPATMRRVRCDNDGTYMHCKQNWEIPLADGWGSRVNS
jgi:hypothetical protein